MRRGLALLLVAGCGDATLPASGPVCDHQISVRVAGPVRSRLDLLFVIDNTFVGPLASDALGLDRLLAALQQLAAVGQPIDLHVGVITTDYGASATGAPGCQIAPGGQQGKLQPLPSPDAAMLDPQLAKCQPPVGAKFLHLDFANPASGNLPPGQDALTTLTCMAAVGNSGCGYVAPLEATYAALHNNPDNAGFLRDDALLMVVFYTNHDDASAPLDSDIFDRTKIQYGYEDSYRAERYGVVCGDPPAIPPYGDSGGPLANCRAAPTGKLWGVDRYIEYFTRPLLQGGVKVDPHDVVLVGVDGPETPFQVIVANPGTPEGTPFSQCPAVDATSVPPCVPVVQHSCQNAAQPIFFADPAVRLNQVIEAAANHKLVSLCDGNAVDAIASFLAPLEVDIGSGCLAAPLDDPAHPDCLAIDVTIDPVTGVSTSTPLAACDAAMQYPCWRVENKPACASLSPQSLGVTVERGPAGAPDDTHTDFYCAASCAN
jgi:hypothetical protein